ncbi:MAG: hypothetical protein K5987_00745 [Lachnospiraceae bacterium]|nr:hypothetical protein [Lachnospiraceae bacterium]
MKRVGRNKGAAMISVLIAITFIGILSTSLLYMAYANYMTKVVRYNSQDNFYSAEFGLDELSASLKQVAYLETDANSAMDALVNAIDPNHDGKYSDNGAAIESNLMKNSSQDVKFNIGFDSTLNTGVSDEYEADYANSKLTLYGLKVEANGKVGTTREGYKSNVTLNLVIKFPSDSKKASPGLSDFSLISDAPFKSGGGDTFFTGCVYLQGVGKNGSPTGPDPYMAALDIKDGMTCLQGSRNIVNGDIIVRKGGILNVTGDLKVNGYIKIESKGALICSGKVQTACGIQAETGAYVTNGINLSADTSVSWNNLPDNGVAGGTHGTGGEAVENPQKWRKFIKSGSDVKYKEYEVNRDTTDTFWANSWITVPNVPGIVISDPDPAKCLTYAQCESKCVNNDEWNTTGAEMFQDFTTTTTPEVGGAKGLASSLFAKYIVVMDSNGNPICLQIRKITTSGGMKYIKPVKYDMSGTTGYLMINGDGGVIHSGDGGNPIVHDCLFMNLFNGETQIKGTCINSTFLSETVVNRDTSQLPIYMQKLDENIYQSMLDSYWVDKDGSYTASIAYNLSDGQLPKTKYIEGAGASGDSPGTGTFVLTNDVHDSHGSIYGGTGATQKKYVINYTQEDGSIKKVYRTFEYYMDGSNYVNLVQLKNFLAEDPNAAIANVFNFDNSPGETIAANKNSVVAYEKWFKNRD